MNINPWLLLAHKLPSYPSNIRVKVWRRLQDLGAIPVKNSIYVLPNRSSTREDFDWLRNEITQSGGEATIFTANSIAQKEDRDIVLGFQKARTQDYSAFLKKVRGINDAARAALDGGHIKDTAFEKIERQWTEARVEWERIGKIDFFGSPNKNQARQALKDGQRLMNRAKAISVKKSPAPPPTVKPKDLRGFVWVTRPSAHIDRLASAWLVRRFIDSKAEFKFASAPYSPRPQEIRFDMMDAEFTHFGDWCTFETLLHRLRLDNPELWALAEIIHDIDLKDRKFARPEASGVALAVKGICRSHRQDADRLKAGLEFFDGIYAVFCGELRK
ncbi:MAG: chromate resistance protein ChrB domain-containing protein [Elusimicrobiota bacterium]